MYDNSAWRFKTLTWNTQCLVSIGKKNSSHPVLETSVWSKKGEVVGIIGRQRVRQKHIAQNDGGSVSARLLDPLQSEVVFLFSPE